MKRLLISLPDNIYDELKNKSLETNYPMTEIVRQYIASGKNMKIITHKPIQVRVWTTSEWSDHVRARDNYTCSKCGMKGDEKTTIAHHILPKKQGGKNAMENGMTLCASCHKIIHGK